MADYRLKGNDGAHLLKLSAVEGAALAPGAVVGGGYKYCQLGAGNAFLRFPRDCRMRPLVMGWFSEFGGFETVRPGPGVNYPENHARFAGSTYDPVSHYRAAAVFDCFKAQGLHPEFLREVSQHQIGLLVRAFDEFDADPRVISRDRSVPLDALGGFLVLRSARAGEICGLLHERGVFADYRQDALRLGPAPYLADDQFRESLQILGDLLKGELPGAAGG
jgi:kynureninase